jgi:hypothetical protein
VGQLIQAIIQRDLLGYRQLPAAAGPGMQAETTAVVTAPLALTAVGAGMFFRLGSHASS